MMASGVPSRKGEETFRKGEESNINESKSSGPSLSPQENNTRRLRATLNSSRPYSARSIPGRPKWDFGRLVEQLSPPSSTTCAVKKT